MQSMVGIALLSFDAKLLLPLFYDLLYDLLPEPNSSINNDQPKINFSILESTLYIFHALAAKVQNVTVLSCSKAY